MIEKAIQDYEFLEWAPNSKTKLIQVSQTKSLKLHVRKIRSILNGDSYQLKLGIASQNLNFISGSLLYSNSHISFIYLLFFCFQLSLQSLFFSISPFPPVIKMFSFVWLLLALPTVCLMFLKLIFYLMALLSYFLSMNESLSWFFRTTHAAFNILFSS